jgi:hypothetical protein
MRRDNCPARYNRVMRIHDRCLICSRSADSPGEIPHQDIPQHEEVHFPAVISTVRVHQGVENAVKNPLLDNEITVIRCRAGSRCPVGIKSICVRTKIAEKMENGMEIPEKYNSPGGYEVPVFSNPQEQKWKKNPVYRRCDLIAVQFRIVAGYAAGHLLPPEGEIVEEEH